MDKRKEYFDKKMVWLKGELGFDPMDKIIMMAGPENAKMIGDLFFAFYNVGVDDAANGKIR